METKALELRNRRETFGGAAERMGVGNLVGYFTIIYSVERVRREHVSLMKSSSRIWLGILNVRCLNG